MNRSTRSDLVSDLGPANGPPGGPLALGMTEAAPLRDPVTPFCRDVLALFHGPLADVRFPDVDRDGLDALTAATCDAQREVEALEATLELARARTLDAQATLADRASRALAYARVFAAGQAALEEAVAAVRAPVSRTAGRTPTREPLMRETDGQGTEPREDSAGEAPRRRGRPRREHVAGAMLPMTMGEASAE